ncbi:MAG: hypothetical protein BA871_12880 [Desulfuromonadales bacterium C00003096]|jgi:hypothetical protein|nr:MAG: hypothetical protein BA871_12880 [Desulfuromonadales bacterium C00003096]
MTGGKVDDPVNLPHKSSKAITGVGVSRLYKKAGIPGPARTAAVFIEPVTSRNNTMTQLNLLK